MIQIIQNEKGYHIVNVTLGCIIDTVDTMEEAQTLKNKILQ